MLHHIHPNTKKSKKGGLTEEEKQFVKGLLNLNYRAQDIVHIINQGRKSTVNLARITEVGSNQSIHAASEEEVRKYIKIQSSYNPQTLLNPYKDSRLTSAREAMISAVQIFNNPRSFFKTEIFCVLANIAWTYLLHEKLETMEKGLSLRHDKKAKSVNEIINSSKNPIENKAVCENLNKIIEIRDAVEHQFFIDDKNIFGGLFQSCCLNFNYYLTKWFGNILSLEHELSLALQFFGIQKEQVVNMLTSDLPPQIQAIYKGIEESPFTNETAFNLKVFYSTESFSKTKSDITQLISYSSDTATSQTSIKKVNKLDEYPLSYTALTKKIQAKDSSISTHLINRIIRENNIKQNLDYAYYSFRNKDQQDSYLKHKKASKSFPSIYKYALVDFIIRKVKELPHD